MEENEGNQRDRESYHPADSREAAEVESKETKCLKRGSVDVRTPFDQRPTRTYFPRQSAVGREFGRCRELVIGTKPSNGGEGRSDSLDRDWSPPEALFFFYLQS
jgi:hypothetical protein